MRCNGCGANLERGPDHCPLCGSEPTPAAPEGRSRENAPSVDDYQEKVRTLRDQLKQLRDEGAEAV